MLSVPKRRPGAFVRLTSSPVRELSGIEKHFCFSFDYRGGYFPVAAPFALVKCFRKSAFRVDLGRIRTDDNGRYSGNSLYFLLMGANH